MGLFLRFSSLANSGNSITILASALSYAQADGNFMYLLTNMSGSAINITGSTSIVGTLTTTGNITGNVIGNLTGTASFASNAAQATTASYILNAVSSSFASTASYVLNAISSSYALSASYTSNADLLDGKNSTIFATTGSNTFIGDQVITGSLLVSGSNTFTNIGTTSLTGSLNVTGSSTLIGNQILIGIKTITGSVFISGSKTIIGNNTVTGSMLITGSTTQTGNNTLIGNTVLSGSINISGSQTFYGTSAFYGNHTLSGSNTITGNTVMSGSIEVSGSSNFRNSVFIVTGSAFFKGIHAISGSTDITGSLNITGDFNVISGSSFRRWGNKLFNYGSFYHTASINPTQNVSGSFIYSTTTESEGVSIISGSRITFDNNGKYNIQFSAQLSTPTAADVHIWLKSNGNNVADTAGRLTTTNNDNLLPSWNYLVSVSSGSYLELAYQSTAANTTFPYVAATGNIPGISPIIVTVTQVA